MFTKFKLSSYKEQIKNKNMFKVTSQQNFDNHKNLGDSTTIDQTDYQQTTLHQDDRFILKLQKRKKQKKTTPTNSSPYALLGP